MFFFLNVLQLLSQTFTQATLFHKSACNQQIATNTCFSFSLFFFVSCYPKRASIKHSVGGFPSTMGEPQIQGNVLKALACNLEAVDQLPPSVFANAASIKEANFSFNSLCGDTLGELVKFTSLETLVLDNNEIVSLKKLPSLPNLTTLWLNNNNIGDVEDVVGSLARQCPKLQYVSLLRNPCCPNELMGKGDAEYRRYRIYVKYRLPTLNKLDAAPFTADEISEAREKGRFLQTAVHKAGEVDAGGEGQAGTSTSVGGAAAEEAAVTDYFARFEKKTDGSDPTKPAGPYFTQQRHFYSGKTSEGNRFIKDDVL